MNRLEKMSFKNRLTLTILLLVIFNVGLHFIPLLPYEQGGEGEMFLISLKAGGTGLNLTAADYVIHMDPWWNPAVEDQASDRVHRIGQTRPVTVYRLVAKDTIEDKIVKLHEQKRDLADSLLSGTDSSGKMSANELLNLITS